MAYSNLGAEYLSIGMLLPINFRRVPQKIDQDCCVASSFYMELSAFCMVTGYDEAVAMTCKALELNESLEVRV